MPDNGWSEHKMYVVKSLAYMTAEVEKLKDKVHQHTEEEARFWAEVRTDIRSMKSQMRWGAGIIASVVSAITAYFLRYFGA